MGAAAAGGLLTSMTACWCYVLSFAKLNFCVGGAGTRGCRSSGDGRHGSDLLCEVSRRDAPLQMLAFRAAVRSAVHGAAVCARPYRGLRDCAQGCARGRARGRLRLTAAKDPLGEIHDRLPGFGSGSGSG